MIKTCDAVSAFKEVVLFPYLRVCLHFPIGIAAVTRIATSTSFIASGYNCKDEMTAGMLLQCYAAKQQLMEPRPS